MQEFSYQIRIDDVVTVVEVGGDVDLSVAWTLSEALEPLITAGGSVVLDCSGVTFFDSMALQVALQAVHKAKDVGTTFALVPSAAVTRVLELAGVSSIFTLYDDLSEVPR